MKLKSILTGLFFLFILSHFSYSQEQEDIKYDFSNFKPITPEAFVESYFGILKEAYEIDPNSITEGIYKIVKPPPEGSRYRPTVYMIQLYSALVEDAIYEWAQKSGYDIAYTVYTGSENFSVISDWGNHLAPSLGHGRHVSHRSPDKTILEEFQEQNSKYTGEVTTTGNRTWVSSVNGIPALFSIGRAITASRQRVMDEQKIFTPNRDASKGDWINYFTSNSNSFSGSISLMDSKYGSWSASCGNYSETSPVTGSVGPAESMLSSVLSYCEAKINTAQQLFYKKMGIEVEEAEISDDKGNEIVVEVSADGYITETRALQKRDLETSEILFSGHIYDKEGNPIDSANVKLKGLGAETLTDESGIFNLFAKAGGKEPYSESMDIKLQKIGITISHEELGDYDENKPFGIVSDGFTTLMLKVNAKGIRPNTVSVKQPDLGSFVEQTMLKVPLVLDANGEGEMEYVPPAYLTNEDLSKKLEVPGLGQLSLPFLWVAEVPIQFTYEDEEGNPGTFEIKIFVTRPPVFPIHGFTGDLSTWADLAGFLREQKYNFVLREYYIGPADESTIERQSQKLGQYIQNTQKAYRESGILQTRVDIVAHSMGGLISRHYISNMAKYGTKAGIVIPYNVKLSREELAAQRFKTPVKIVDIRKLIMVGTPNHGATWIDGRIGYLGAYLGNVHEVANSQLRSNSQFLANLNAGENEGRHLDANVQYALLYGRRRLKSLYPPDNLKFKYTDPVALARGYVTQDDGVVMVSSAKLNGVIDYAFPEKIDNPYGFIHSPSLSFPFVGDKSITTDIEIFNKINELLLEDIIRVPLKNSFAKVFDSEGEVYMRYYSSEVWQPLPASTNKKLEHYWSQFKTGEGHTRIAFFQNNYHWGSINIEPNTILRIENASPELVEVYLQQGKARFTSRKQQGGSFEIAMGDETEKWYNFNPKALVMDINTDFIIDKNDFIKVQSIKGGVSVGISDEVVENIRGKKIDGNEGVELTATNEMIDSPLPESGWWSAIDTSFLPDEKPVSDPDVFTDSACYMRPDILDANQKMINSYNVLTTLMSEGKGDTPEAQTAYANYKADKDNYEIMLSKCLESSGLIFANLPISEDFTHGCMNWDTSKMRPEIIDGKLFWNVGENNPIILNKTIPLQNIVIEFDGWTDKNGIGFEWFNDEIKGYNVGIGAYFNTKSAIGFKDQDTYEFSWFPGAHLTLSSWHHYKFVLESDKLDIFLDGELIGSKTIYQTLAGEGKLSISSYQSRIGIDNLYIYAGNSTILSNKQISQQNLIENGSFEEGPDIGGYLVMREGVKIPGWEVTRATVDLTGTYFKASDGDRSIDLVGTPGFGAIQQSIKTIPGKTYQLKFDMAGNPSGGPVIKEMEVSAGAEGAVFKFDITGKTSADMGWEERSWNFTATTEETTLIFSAIEQANPTNYGPAIDNIQLYEVTEGGTASEVTSEEEIAKPVQNLGEAKMEIQDVYLPISGFTNLQIEATNDQGEPLASPYPVSVKLKDQEQLPFVSIGIPNGTIDENGKFKTIITIDEPKIGDYQSISEIPFEATIQAQVVHPQTQNIVFEKEITLPLGMMLLEGQTLGPDYTPRQQPLPPEFKPTSYQIANQVDEKGNFYILFNTALYLQDIDKFKKLAERTQEVFSMDQFEFSLEWSESCSLPLTYHIPDSIKALFTKVNHIKIGKNGMIDLLSAEEQEARIKQLTTHFLEQMPLKPEIKSFVLSKLDRLFFRYGTTAMPYPGFTDKLSFSNVIEAPSSRNGYWSKIFLNGPQNPAFNSMLHAMGHFLQHAIVLENSRYFNFLSGRCNGDEKIWNHQQDLLKYMFDNSEYNSFSEAGADFFTYLMYKFILQNESGLANKSIYFHPGYLSEFENNAKAMKVIQQYPAYAVSGSQTAFLVNYYKNSTSNNPAKTYSDFLLTQILFGKQTIDGESAATINEWLLAKSLSFDSEFIVNTSNPTSMASQFGLVKETAQIRLIPTADFENASIEINGNMVTNFSQIPAAQIKPATIIKIVSGTFKLVFMNHEKISVIEMPANAKIKIESSENIELMEGDFEFYAPIPFKTELATFRPSGDRFSLKLEAELTSIEVVNGELNIVSEKDDEVVRAGESTTMNKNGRIKKPKRMENQPVQNPSKLENPFLNF